MSHPGLAAVARLTDALSRATTLDAVYGAALDALQQSLGVARASVLLFDEQNVMSFVAWRGISDDYRRAVNGHTPWRPDMPDPQPIVVEDVLADSSLAEYLPVFKAEGIRSLAFFPLNYRGRVIGKFMLYYAEPHTFGNGEIQLAQTIAGQIAFGVARVRAENELQLDLARRVLAEKRANFLAEVSKVLASSLDYETTLEHVAQLVVGELADWCTIDVREDDGELRRLAVIHRDPARDTPIQRMRVVNAYRDRAGVIRRVAQSGESVLIKKFDFADFEKRYGDDPEVLDTLRALGVTSYMIVPLVAGGRSFGAISVISANPQRQFDESDLELAEELGRRAGYAVDNARLYRQAQDANRAKDEFLVTLSHELRTPMTATLGWATMLRRQDLSPENYRLAVETIERSTRAQAKLIDDILDVSRIVTGKLQLSVAPVSLRSIVEAAVDAIRPSVNAKGLELRLQLTDAPAVAIADAARVQQVLWNILSNAVKFTPPGGTITVTLHTPIGDHAAITVSDTGIGIARKFLPHIFERFRQAESGPARAHGGLGLGLAIVRSIVELHGGSVAAQSDGEGTGATFTVTMPVATQTVTPSAPQVEVNAPLALAGVSVLLVEDEDDTRYMLSAALQSFGARVTAVRSVAAAVESMQASQPHVVVSDIGMPGEDGFDLMMRIRGDGGRLRAVPAIAVTAYAGPEDRERVLASGFNYHLAKPVDPLLVVQTVREAAGR